MFFGYEDDGKRIIGYDYNKGFEPGVSPQSDISREDWEGNLAGYILLESKDETVSERDAALSAFSSIAMPLVKSMSGAERCRIIAN